MEAPHRLCRGRLTRWREIHGRAQGVEDGVDLLQEDLAQDPQRPIRANKATLIPSHPLDVRTPKGTPVSGTRDGKSSIGGPKLKFTHLLASATGDASICQKNRALEVKKKVPRLLIKGLRFVVLTFGAPSGWPRQQRQALHGRRHRHEIQAAGTLSSKRRVMHREVSYGEVLSCKPKLTGPSAPSTCTRMFTSQNADMWIG